MEKTLTELAQRFGGTVVGDGAIKIKGLASLSEAQEGHITFLANPKYRCLLSKTRASAIIASEVIDELKTSFLIVSDPYLVYAKIARLFFLKPYESKGISNGAIISLTARVGKDVTIAPFVYVGENVVIGDRVTLYPGVYIGDDVKIGDDVIFYPNVTILRDSFIGDRVILHSGVVIGGDGFGYAQEKGRYVKIPQAGSVHIDDDVEIGSNSTVDRAALGKTWIKRGVKIDNLVMVAHNVVVGEDTVIVAQSGIAGSSELGNNVILAAQSGIAGHLKIGNKAIVGARGGVSQDISPGTMVSGAPAIPHRDWLKAVTLFSRFPELYQELRGIKKKVEALENQLKKMEEI
ncbi:MAG: UDP-3-O-(3-hydroxymyristoyl)glucosamine N-acyltransferase [Thermodesulfobacteriota bacterium]|nr:MAG: UDP-3-O-(3-hydroxymyristoyl)glucosamine N-acyltransferase [Thermodesulfobacteriota bacterium]